MAQGTFKWGQFGWLAAHDSEVEVREVGGVLGPVGGFLNFNKIKTTSKRKRLKMDEIGSWNSKSTLGEGKTVDKMNFIIISI